MGLVWNVEIVRNRWARESPDLEYLTIGNQCKHKWPIHNEFKLGFESGFLLCFFEVYYCVTLRVYCLNNTFYKPFPCCISSSTSVPSSFCVSRTFSSSSLYLFTIILVAVRFDFRRFRFFDRRARFLCFDKTSGSSITSSKWVRWSIALKWAVGVADMLHSSAERVCNFFTP